MTEWSRGYVADSLYTVSYQAGQAPAHLALACAMVGVEWQPRPDMTVVDIGCGRGFSVNTLAASNPGWTVVGLDYNPAQIAEAAGVAERAALANAIFVEADLASMTEAEMDRIPLIDVAMLHGVWTWVGDDVRAGIVRLLARRLKPGGIAYFGYNALPGFGRDMALQRLFRHVSALQSTGNSNQRAHAAMDTVKALHATKPRQLYETPMLKRIAEDDTPIDGAYLAHEFLTDHWRPVFHEDLCAALAPAKLEFATSATLSENIPDLIFGTEQREVFERMPSGPSREFMKDLCMARPFRRDIFVRGLRRTDHVAALDRIPVALCRGVIPPELKIVVQVGIAELTPQMWEPISKALLEGPQTLGYLRSLPEGRKPNPAELLAMLDGCGVVMPVLRDSGPTPETQRYNRVAADTYAEGGVGRGQFALASPVAAGGVPCTSLELAVAVDPDVAAGTPPPPETLALRLLPNLDEEGLRRGAAVIAEILEERTPVWKRFGIV
ncbi:class I SAM-dependent methyltransferase [Humitalea sp. 24SJ18S-53]|uniref:class I SAM-dependent methyltransferase n=1 Tax=Humitalea sp. 24SJ18S-53 TaxID=3422307 RepID=UPI003D678BA3